MGQGILGSTAAVALALWSASAASQTPTPSTCFNHERLTKSSPISKWNDIAQRAVPPALVVPPISAVQRVQDGAGNTNRDYYHIRFKAAPGQTAESVFQDFRANLRERIFKNQFVGTVRGYDKANEEKWRSTAPLGAVMTFVMFDVPVLFADDSPTSKPAGRTEFEKGSVVLSCISETDFVFSTVTTPLDGLHPVSGSRGFGVSLDPDGYIRVVTKAVDRVADHPVYQTGAAFVFAGGDRIWKGMLANLRERYKAQEPDPAVAFRRP